ncbi:MAG: hypothetical protein QHH13_10090 [Melioribacter sp.]|uniref:hypothetical protein n=1 Tax=Rosettibacter primus TaxID=3111523 RepID=UPI00247EE32F|nr:hypothetical protein [Melioribacter sp.]
MKTKPIFFLVLLVGYVLLKSEAFSQETKESKKALDAFINPTTKSAVASEPVPGAEITVEQQPGPIIIKKCVTDKNGEFTVLIEEIELAFEKIERKGSNKIFIPNEINLQFTIKPKDPDKYPSLTNKVKVTIKKSDGPKFVFVVTYQKPIEKSSGTTNKGTFAVSSKAQT